MNAKELMIKARQCGTVIPAYNIPYLPMLKPVVQAVVDENSFAMIQVARVEWEKFGSQSLEAVAGEYEKYKNPAHTLLHLDHIPVIDEDFKEVDYLAYIKNGVAAGFQSVMVDASRLGLDENISATKQAADIAHAAGLPCEAELGAVMGHESGPLAPYEEIFATKKGFTDLEEARQFVRESGCDWLSVAVGNIHGAVADHLKHQKKPEARLDVGHIKSLYEATEVPLVLHGGSGVNPEYIRRGIEVGIAKINVGTEIRQAYSLALEQPGGEIARAQEAVYNKVREIIRDMLCTQNTHTILLGK